MYWPPNNPNKHCRWCQKRYYAHRPYDRDGFCSKACKQAHHRAYKKYVTAKSADQAGARTRAVTQKKQKKRK